MINPNELFPLVMEWIPKYEGVYAVSNAGDVFTFNKGTVAKLKPTKNKANGYLYVMLQDGGVRENVTVHRLVAEAFVHNPRPQEYNVVNHKDENKENPFCLNLEWTTTKKNVQYSLKKGYIVTTPTGEEVEVVSLRAFALENGLDPSGMTKVAKGKQKTHKGYKVQYKPN